VKGCYEAVIIFLKRIVLEYIFHAEAQRGSEFEYFKNSLCSAPLREIKKSYTRN
jgi:hypothetical protein